ncbi:acireductone dioxygenase [Cytobacillus kochii]|uniref:1,2-dihydroxy-3-keto-5-methylthiopentene dioxygenase n=1 Tax=Cytobacillus TaxID=2675230 RepID=UPI00278015BB|nr:MULTISPECIES: cupin domain-containing protein [Cytobacillus]MDQ0188046.1 1,2-dihydroxy-3-keto-5-methylthiopentene dioxygenase [Cytobacillus kochii]MEA1854223.1 cupin domain-containing protein [Cytobacillus sp. OWB-43]
MAIIKFKNEEKVITDQQEVSTFLTAQEVIYENWNIEQLEVTLHEKYDLSDDEKQAILDAFSTEIKTISEKRGYKAADVISLSDSTPNLDELLINFQREHHHTDDEVRFIVSGHGVFIIQGKDESFFEVHLDPGDLISVPVNTRHYFTLSDDRKVVAIRLFVTPEGWVPVYEKEKLNA